MVAIYGWKLTRITLLISIVVTAASDGRLRLQSAVGVESNRNTTACWSSLSCRNTKNKPVCGTDGLTYSSKCHLKKTRECDGIDVHHLDNGPCGASPVVDGRCLEDRKQTLLLAQGSNGRSPGVYVPECLSDGTFSPVQCHSAAGYCWCVTPDGRPIPETSVQGTEVRCRDKGLPQDAAQRGSKTRRGLRAKSCAPTERKEFNKNLVHIFSEEHARDPTINRTDDRHYDAEVITWKFTQLDVDRDGILRKNDIRTLKKMLKKLVKPRKCAKTFDKHCDLDQDGRIRRDEWAICLGGDVTVPRYSGKMCTNSERATFNKQLVSNFISEYNEKLQTSKDNSETGSTTQSVSSLDTVERRAIAWKFRELDKDQDGRLRRDEIRQFKSLAKQHMTPRSCAKILDKNCDLDKDQFIVYNEWLLCIGADINISFRLFLSLNSDAPTGGGGSMPGGRNHGSKGSGTVGGGNHGSSAQKALLEIITSGTSSLSLSTDPKGADPSQLVSDQERRSTDPPHKEESVLDSGCVKARLHFMENHRADPGAHIFVPVCQDDGTYRREQCHNATGYCWCVEQKTGRPIPTTSTRNVMPNCTNIKIREFKGCSYPLRKQFLTKLLDKLTTDMMEFAHNASDKSPVLDTDPDLTLEERAVRWKLRVLDKNRNEILDRKEMKQFKIDVRMKKELRKCSRNFLRYCDENEDGDITLLEWIDCTGINEEQRNLPDHSKGINPFTEYLKGAQ